MAEIVFVHGIANEQLGADMLESAWRAQLAGGMRVAGHRDLADRVVRDRSAPEALDARMAFYGYLFLERGQQGADTGELGAEAQALAAEWLRNVAERSRDAEERDEASRAIASSSTEDVAQGTGAVAGGLIRGLTRVSWFADPIFGATAFVHKALRQVTRYLQDPHIRPKAQELVLDLIGPETRVIIAHSLGTVVAWEALHRRPASLPLFLTLGSPLGLRHVIYDKLWPHPPTFPPGVERWVNVADRDDFIASEPNLAKLFPRSKGAIGQFDGTWTVDNGASPHNAEFYLGKEMIGEAVARAFHGWRPKGTG